MKLRNTILALSMLASIPAVAMEMPPQPAIEYYNSATLLGLPNDIKSCLFPMLTSTDIAETELEILVLAATNKQLIDSPQVMIAILDAVQQKVRFTAHAVELAERLQKKVKTVPVMNHELVCNWIAKMKDQMEGVSGIKYASFREAILNYGLFCMEPNFGLHKDFWYKKIFEFLDDKNLNVNTLNGQKRTIPLECLCEGYGFEAIQLCISLGIDIDIPDDRGGTCLQVAQANKRYDVVALLQQAQEDRKQKLALKQPVKQ